MDPLTHTLAGAALSRAGLGRVTALGGAACVIGANLPDLDALAYIAGSDAALAFRRGWTHGVLAMVVLPALLTSVLIAFHRFARGSRDGPPLHWGRLAAVSYAATLSHPALDWLNTYGIRFLMPFDDRWFYGDAVFIVDPWLWLMLGTGVFLAVRRRPAASLAGWITLATFCSVALVAAGSLLPSEARWIWFAALSVVALASMLRVGGSNMWAAAGLTLAATYVAGMVVTSHLAEDRVLSELAKAGIDSPRRLMVGPKPANPRRWEIVAELPETYRLGEFRWGSRPVLDLDSRAIDKGLDSTIVDAALRSPHVRGARIWMRFPFVEVDSDANGHTVFLLDARYLKERARGFGSAKVELDRALRVRKNR